MWFRLINASPWKLGLLFGVYFGIVMGVGGYLQDHELVEHIILGVVSGAVFGAVMGPIGARQNQRAFAATGEELSPVERELVARAASSRQPIPDDTRLRKAAEDVLSYRLSALEEQRWSNFVVLAGSAAATVAAALVWSMWWLGATVTFAALAALTFTRRRRMEQRIVQLQMA